METLPRSPRRVGVLTFHGCINYGSYWQARCLVEGLQARGHDAVILDHRSRRVNLVEWKCAYRPVLPTPVPRSDYPLYRQKIRAFFRALESLPVSRPFALENPADMDPCDTVVVGSDEVWNLRHPWYGGCPLFYGTGLRADRVIAYAASFGNYDGAAGLAPFWADRLRQFEAISVRDENSRRIISTALGVEPDLVLDPCLQFPLEAQGEWYGPEEPFVAVYGHNFTGWFSAAVRCWARAHGYRLLSLGYRNDWADEQWITAGPHDFAHGMARATAVATNFFHGCVFALRNAKPFVSELTPYRTIKVQDLLGAVGGLNRLVGPEAPDGAYAAALGTPLEPAIVQRLDQLRRSSAAYLEEALV
ncbi:MAG TPA: polysaccharide pyruvyl transferase family protein [Chloroflexia bacterium]|nr:polysaccharide pyruvyl transferase family protein [Chloroflexia bacterium]